MTLHVALSLSLSLSLFANLIKYQFYFSASPMQRVFYKKGC
jgi:hypothetical protein